MEAEAQPLKTNINDAVINSFCEITSSSKEEALFFLESHNFDLDAAVSTFFDNPPSNNNDNDIIDGNNNTPSNPIPPFPSPSPSDPQSSDFSPSQSPSRSRSQSPTSSRGPYQLRSRRASGKADKRPSGSRTRGIRTLEDLKPSDRERSDSDSDESQEYYTGGEKSGMLVKDPTKGNNVDDIFNRARQAATIDGLREYPQKQSKSKSFTGTARLLSGETISSPQTPEALTHTITFWRNGFSVDNGPLRRLDDPENANFLESIKRSECPKELEPANRKTVVHVSLTRQDEDYPEPLKRPDTFQGVGRTLGSSSSSSQVSFTEASSSNTTPLPSIGLAVDESLPTTSIQLRLADGTRIISRFNHNHTIRDVRAFIDASRPNASRNYQLQSMGFPPKQLADIDQTIEQAGIGNSVVIQKL